MTERNYQFTYKEKREDYMAKDYRTKKNSAKEAIEDFDKERPGCIFIGMVNNDEL